jgi:glyoxylase-like metal-dependent hydrolase (beta-lactamase superfamily II)
MWIDCPSSFDSSLKPVDAIIFTHHHFLGTSNLYREHFSAQVRIHRSDSSHGLCRGFVFDDTFQEDFAENGLEAFHVNGHTPGFTFYIFGNTLLICDYVFYNERSIQFNPYGPRIETEQAAQKIREIIDSRSIDKVCGYNYVADYAEWKSSFDSLFEGRPNRDI